MTFEIADFPDQRSRRERSGAMSVFAYNRKGKTIALAPTGGAITSPSGLLPLAYELLQRVRIDGAPNEVIRYRMTISNGVESFSTRDRVSRLSALGAVHDERIVLIPKDLTSNVFTASVTLLAGSGSATSVGLELLAVKISSS